jgi:hypothetical protein
LLPSANFEKILAVGSGHQEAEGFIFSLYSGYRYRRVTVKKDAAHNKKKLCFLNKKKLYFLLQEFILGRHQVQ